MLATTTPKRFIAYIRVSRVAGREGESFISPELQRDKIEAWAKMREVEIAAEFVDLDESGGTQDRPGLKDAIAMVERGEADGIVVAYLSRFARNVAGALADIERIHKAGGSVAFVAENLDPTTPMGKAMLTVLLAFAALERDNVSQSWLDSRQSAVERGVWMGSRTPFGYLKGEDGRLSVHPDEAPIVREAYRLAAEHDIKAACEYFGAMTAIATAGKRAGVRVIRNGDTREDRPLYPAWMRAILSNRVYLGEQRAGNLFNATNHDGIVSRDLWERAQSESTLTRKAAQSYPLSGLATCSACGDFLVGHSGSRYICRSYVKGACQSSATISAAILKDYVVGTILASYNTHGRSTLLVSRPDDAADLDSLQADIERAENERTAYALDTELQSAIGRDAYLAGAKARTEAVVASQRAYREAAEQVRQAYEDLAPDVLASLEGEDLNRALSGVFRAIVVGPVRVDGRRVPLPERVALTLHSDADAEAIAA